MVEFAILYVSRLRIDSQHKLPYKRYNANIGKIVAKWENIFYSIFVKVLGGDNGRKVLCVYNPK